jgi:hypothetical protein
VENSLCKSMDCRKVDCVMKSAMDENRTDSRHLGLPVVGVEAL